MGLVTSKRLAEKLQVSLVTLTKWRRAGFLVPATTIKDTPHYSIESIDGILQRGATNFTYAVSAADILWGKAKLLTLKQAGEKMGMRFNALHHRIERGKFPAIKLREEWRVIEQDVDDFIAQSNNPENIPRGIAAHIFGSGVSYIRERIRCGDLRCATISKKPVVKPVILESILSLLQRLAPPWVNPEAWVAERQEDERPLMDLQEFERFMGLGNDRAGVS